VRGFPGVREKPGNSIIPSKKQTDCSIPISTGGFKMSIELKQRVGELEEKLDLLKGYL
jgi:hypothetical protein